jgi:hypothetical protein
MRYLKRLKNELQDLTEKLTPKGPNPEYVSVKKLNRQTMLRIVISLIQKARAFYQATEEWTPENSEAWEDFLASVNSWLKQVPKIPEGLVEKSKTAA